MKGLLLGLLLWQVAEGGPAPEPRHQRYERTVTLPAGASGQACATLDAAVYAHAAEALKDVRLYDGQRELPYAITLSQSTEEENAPARVLNLGKRGGRIVFDLAMPDRPYTDVFLDLDGRDFIATAVVTGVNSAHEPPTSLGSFTLFDLSEQHLGRSTVLHLPESRFAVLHIEMTVSAAPGVTALSANEVNVRGASVPPSREAQTLYTPVDEAFSLERKGQKTVARFRLPMHVPVERVSFELAPGYAGNFSRSVEISAEPAMRRQVGTNPSPVETVQGTIERVRLTRSGRDLKQERLSVPATLGSNMQGNADVEVEVDNGDDPPLPLTAVRLEMRQRMVCFPVQASGLALTLFYGDDALEAPRYDFARVLSLAGAVAVARLGPEEKNPGYVARAPVAKSLTERHPELLWVALLGGVCVLAVAAAHSAKRMPR